MKLWDIAKSVGGTAIKTALPGTEHLVVGAVNAILPPDKKLPTAATGDDITLAIGSLSEEKQAEIMQKEIDVRISEIEQINETLRTALIADSQNQHTTRPHIAKYSFYLIAFVSIVIVLIWAYAVVVGNSVIIKAITGGWPFIAAIITPFVTLLLGYFGTLRKSDKDSLYAKNGIFPTNIASVLLEYLKKRKS